ncbi:histidine phosphatase family protein [Streptococcus entericus]|uniref:histidine phosphatase family protein n=1 Tax=Streptococcus entericus TaxID=155680 RepID=UPI00036D492F|nr:histidine phosphatase family protein [Streptococcus entericus]
MTKTIYLVRHAEPNYNNHDDVTRELTAKGLQDCQLLVDFFKQKPIDKIVSSPYKRAVETIQPVADQLSLPIELMADFRERKIDDVWIEDFKTFTANQWQDFVYKYSDSGESLAEVQHRTIAALTVLLENSQAEQLIVSSHGTAISTMLNYYNPNFGLADFEQLKTLMPFVVELVFDNLTPLSITLYNLFTGENYDYTAL